MSAIAYNLLQNKIIENHSEDFVLWKVAAKDKKGMLSLLFYIAGIILSFFMPWLGILCYIAVLVMWFIPDRQIENSFKN